MFFSRASPSARRTTAAASFPKKKQKSEKIKKNSNWPIMVEREISRGYISMPVATVAGVPSGQQSTCFQKVCMANCSHVIVSLVSQKFQMR
ncbi:hypothetical protein DICVIV_13599, partial [Dictyocaulus viviparus]